MSADFIEEISEPCPEGSGVTIDDFVAYMPAHVYIFTPCREPWTQASVNARLPPVPVLDKHGCPKRVKGKLVTISASKWLDQNRPVEQMTWCPGFPMLIKDRLVVDGGWIERKDVTCFNHYRPSRIRAGDARPIRGSSTSARSIPTTPTTPSRGWRTGCSARARRSTTRWCSAACRVSARTLCSSR
jgi:hypothetical protein